MANIIALYEIEKLARQLILKNRKTSVWPLLFIIEMSKTTGYVKLTSTIRNIHPKNKNDNFIIDPVRDLIDIETRQDYSRSPSQKPTRYAKLKQPFDLYPLDSYEGQISEKIFNRSVIFARQYTRVTSLMVLVQMAVSVRRLCSSRDIYNYINSGFSAKTSAINILEKMTEICHIQIAKTGDHQTAENIIFEID